MSPVSVQIADEWYVLLVEEADTVWLAAWDDGGYWEFIAGFKREWDFQETVNTSLILQVSVRGLGSLEDLEDLYGFLAFVGYIQYWIQEYESRQSIGARIAPTD